MALAVAWAAVPLHRRFKPGAGSSPLPRRGEGIVAPVRPRASPAVASLRVLPSGAWALRKGRVPSSSGKEGGVLFAFWGWWFLCVGFWVWGLESR